MSLNQEIKMGVDPTRNHIWMHVPNGLGFETEAYKIIADLITFAMEGVTCTQVDGYDIKMFNFYYNEKTETFKEKSAWVYEVQADKLKWMDEPNEKGE